MISEKFFYADLLRSSETCEPSPDETYSPVRSMAIPKGTIRWADHFAARAVGINLRSGLCHVGVTNRASTT